MKRTFLVLFAAALFTLPAMPVMAQEDPIFTQQELIDLVGEAVVQETTEKSEEVRKAKEILDAVRKEGTTTEQEQAQKDVEEAEADYAKAQGKLDEARVNAFAEQSGKSPSEIQAMRDSGMGWGRIAKETGVHPSASGKGKGKSKIKSKTKGKGKKQYIADDEADDEAVTSEVKTEDEVEIEDEAQVEDAATPQDKTQQKGQPKDKSKSKTKGKGNKQKKDKGKSKGKK